MEELYVINSLGEREIFSKRKIYTACRNAGLDDFSAQEIADKIEKEAYPGITTLKISQKISGFLRKESLRSAMKFSLKRAMAKLGPAGFLFEKYVGEILAKNGYKIKLNQQLIGFSKCVYEIDFLAEKDNLIYLGECKYHNKAGERVDLKIALANHARFLDIQKNHPQSGKLRSILVTNTKFTSQAIRYSECAGVNVLGWKYPEGRGLEILIETKNLYPITILPSFKGYLADVFAEKGIMLASDLIGISSGKLSRNLGINEKEIKNLTNEARILLE
ncbi:MAG: restriction endonuclease [Candidatus Pacebacteria bacterium]|nr:restriction endonuclease [Candidatus Paceibacterota bacterium]